MSFENHEWRVFELNALCTVTDCQHKTAPVVDYKTKFRMLRTTNIRNGRINSDDARYVTEETYEAWSVRGKLVEDDVILTREAPMGEVGIIKSSNEKFFLGQRMLQLKAKTDVILPYFLYYSLLAPEVQNQIKMHEGTGSVVSNIRIPALKKFKLKVPALKTQATVSRILRLIDDKIDLNYAINKNLEEMAQALFKRWFVDFEFPNENGEPYKSSGGEFEESELGSIPKGWKVNKLGNLGDFKNGINYDRDQSGANEYQIINVKDIVRSNYLIQEELATLQIEEQKAMPYLVRKNDIIIARSAQPGESIFCLNEVPNVIHSGFSIRFRPNDATQAYYLHSVIQLAKSNLDQYSNGTIFKNVNQQILGSYLVLVPRDSVVMLFNRIIEPMVQAISKKTDETRQLTDTRDTLLPKLMAGEIRVPVEQEYTQVPDLPMAAENKEHYSTT